MKLSTYFRHIRKGALLLFVLTLLAGYSVHDALSHYTGEDVPGTAEQGGCNAGGFISCHGSLADSTTVIRLFTPAKIIAGQTYKLTISVSNPNPEDVAAGFDVDIDTPAILDTVPGMNTFVTLPDTFNNTVEWSIAHSMPQVFKGDSAVWSFLYTARPTPGVDTFYVAGNAVNGDSAVASDSDRWNDVVFYITVLPAPNIVTPSASGNVFQAYPNPATNEIFVNDGAAADVGSYTLTDAAGRVVVSGNQISLDGRHSIDVSGIAAGAYILNVQTRNGPSWVRRIVIQR